MEDIQARMVSDVDGDFFSQTGQQFEFSNSKEVVSTP